MLQTGTALAAGTLAGPVFAEKADWTKPVVVRSWVGPRPATANRAPLHAQPLYQLPAGAVKPAGWLKQQLQIQAYGLSGHLDETWDDAGPNSAWLGGNGESWERGPYFIDGLLPLAWLLDDPALKVKAQRWVDWTLNNTRPDGMFGPHQTAGRNKPDDDWWPRMVMLKVLMQYHELTEDPRVIPVMTAYFHHQLAELPTRPLQDWGMVRWQDNALTALWLYNRTGDAKLIELANLLEKQGGRWQRLFAADYPFTGPYYPREARQDPVPAVIRASDPTGKEKPGMFAHGVNNGQALKVGPITYIYSGKPSDRDFVFKQLATLDKYHGLPIGMFSGSEHLAGTSVSQGTETCTVVETLYSLECAMAVTGSAALGDRIEKIAYNALPAALDEAMWTRQYLQQPNQVKATIAKGPWVSDGPESHTFGLETNFGCCTANFHQGWPKLVQNLYMASADGGLAATAYGPCSVDTVVKGVPVKIAQTTNYPFRKSIRIALKPARAVAFPLRLRIPAWAESTAISVNGKAQAATPVDGFARIDRRWAPGDVVEMA